MDSGGPDFVHDACDQLSAQLADENRCVRPSHFICFFLSHAYRLGQQRGWLRAAKEGVIRGGTAINARESCSSLPASLPCVCICTRYVCTRYMNSSPSVNTRICLHYVRECFCAFDGGSASILRPYQTRRPKFILPLAVSIITFFSFNCQSG